MNLPTRACLVAVASVVITGCQTYRPKPLADKNIIDNVLTERNRIPATPNVPLTIEEAAAWMDEFNPELRQIRTRYAQLSALAELKTPIPNPTLGAGLARAFRLSPAEASRTQPFVELGFTVPLGNKRVIEDDLRTANAELARTEILVRHRELFLELRKAYYEYASAHAHFEEFGQLLGDAEGFQKATQLLAEAGSLTGLDVGMADMEIGRLELDRSRLEEDVRLARSELATVIGVQSAKLADRRAARLVVDGFPTADQQVALMRKHQPGLARLKSEYAIAELELKLEIAKQYPDLEIGSSAEQEPGEPTRIFGLGAAITLPVFDKNEIGIRQADNRRELLRAEFGAHAAEVLSQLDGVMARAETLATRQATLEERLLPTARRNQETAKQMLEAGRLDVLRYLEISRGVRELELEIIELRGERATTILELERLIGAPLNEKDKEL